jgi:DNA-binding response OmpR family regulator
VIATYDISNLRAVPARILLVEDDVKIGHGVTQALENGGYVVDWVTSGRDALDVAVAQPPELVLLDLGLPDIDGVDVCAELRAVVPAATIVILTARTDEIDVVVGLDSGADDYVTKPFRLAELLARVRAHLRRPHGRRDAESFAVGSLVVDLASRKATCRALEIDLRPKEFDLLVMLVANAGRALTREQIMEEVWDEHWFGSTKTLDMHISALRRKLGDCDESVVITTLRGVGYRLERPAG